MPYIGYTLHPACVSHEPRHVGSRTVQDVKLYNGKRDRMSNQRDDKYILDQHDTPISLLGCFSKKY